MSLWCFGVLPCCVVQSMYRGQNPIHTSVTRVLYVARSTGLWGMKSTKYQRWTHHQVKPPFPVLPCGSPDALPLLHIVEGRREIPLFLGCTPLFNRCVFGHIRDVSLDAGYARICN